MTTQVSIYGAGPTGLMAAEVLATAGCTVTLHDKMAAPARKFLLAGRGGLNLTHSESPEKLLTRYDNPRIADAVRAFPPAQLLDWCHGLGIDTFVGSSGRVFPKSMKASPLLRAWLRRLGSLGVTLKTRSPWQGFDDRPAILAFGGASWPHLGSDAAWVQAFSAAGITVEPFKPANGRFLVPWTEHMHKHAGQPIKTIALTYRGTQARGEVMLSRDGIEGGAVYALSRLLRDEPGEALQIDLRPDLSAEVIAAKLAARRTKDSHSNFLRKAFNLSPTAIALMMETRATDPKQVRLTIGAPAGLARAISSAGGVAWSEIGEDFQLLKQPGVFVAGEMLDWEAPTGGYLLQGCFATGVAAARGLLAHLKHAP